MSGGSTNGIGNEGEMILPRDWSLSARDARERARISSRSVSAEELGSRVSYRGSAGCPSRDAMAKRHRWGEDPGADLVKTGKLIGQGIGKLGVLVKHRAASRRLPENLVRLAAAIEEFRPAKKYDYEFPYQIELTGFLKARLGGSITIEETRGRSRPDIVVDGTIAIEIKGPTSNHQLDTIADKAVRYGRHFEGVSSVCCSTSWIRCGSGSGRLA